MPSGARVVVSGEGARVTASPDGIFSARVSPKSHELLFRAGQIPEELKESAKEWLDNTLSMAGILIDEQNDQESTFTRNALMDKLARFRRQVAQGRAISAPRNIERHLLDVETARLRHERLADRWWGPSRATTEANCMVRREAVSRVKSCRSDCAALLALLNEAINALHVAPERRSEIMARRGRLDQTAQYVIHSVGAFWTRGIRRRHDDLKGMIALADVVWRLLGQPKKEQAIREAFARHRERPG